MVKYEERKLKGQSNARKDKNVECRASAFKELRKMKTVDSVEILERCLKEEITIADIRREAKAIIKEMKEVSVNGCAGRVMLG